MQIDRMALADLGNILQIAEEVLKQLGEIQPPVPIEDIAKAVDIDRIEDLTTKGFEGALITNAEKTSGTILVNRDSFPERRRFTIGHELGHYLSPWHKPPEGKFLCSKADMFANTHDGKSRARMEVEANQFSAEILMPAPLFRRDIQKRKSPTLEHVLSWSERYQTSKVATTRRFVDLHDSASAMIVTKDGVVTQIHKPATFPYIDLKYGQGVHGKSSTARYKAEPGQCSNTVPTEPSLWTSTPPKRGTEMYEQVLVQRDGYRITLLTIDDAEAEDDDEEHERERSEWDPRFK